MEPLGKSFHRSALLAKAETTPLFSARVLLVRNTRRSLNLLHLSPGHRKLILLENG